MASGRGSRRRLSLNHFIVGVNSHSVEFCFVLFVVSGIYTGYFFGRRQLPILPLVLLVGHKLFYLTSSRTQSGEMIIKSTDDKTGQNILSLPFSHSLLYLSHFPV